MSFNSIEVSNLTGAVRRNRGCPLPDPENTKTFAVLQKMVRVNLVVPIGAPHMWHAAMESRGMWAHCVWGALAGTCGAGVDLMSVRPDLRLILDGLIDRLALIEHERWAHWQTFVHKNCVRQSDGSLTIPSELAERWQRQIDTPFSQLSESEKESDRKQVERYLPIIAEELECRLSE